MLSEISVNVMAHPDRRHFVDELLADLGDVPVLWDRKGDRWDTGRRALLAHVSTGARWGLTIQDDAILCQDLVAGAERAARVAGERPISLYVGKVRPRRRTVTSAVRQARRLGAPWVSMEGPHWGVGIVVPTAHIPELVAWADQAANPNYDLRIEAFYEQLKTDCWYTIPSLVDHRPVAENPSLIAGRTGNRRAHWFIGSERSALDIDWEAQPPVRLRRQMEFRHARTGELVAVARGTSRCRRLERSALWDLVEPDPVPSWLPRRGPKEEAKA